MRRTPWARLLLVAAGSTVVSYGALRVAESRGATLLPVPVLSSLVVLLIAAVVLTLGWAVRQYTQGKRPGLDPILAARTVVLATASAYTGALLSGWYGGQVVLVLGDLEIAARRDVAQAAGLALLCTVALAVVGLVVERWCEVRPRDDDDGPGPGTSAASGSTA
ncbi:DUF3180 domain-containing protein [Actinotalea subterranea]|uniref:DUF3180 domain-containing protein n=1 Tax=Actinotalea subterranea TaxID=2607497 RepID=UPI0011EC7BA2|nr:DUF3180 domain-containing protein [Actinotalea subterranea]